MKKTFGYKNRCDKNRSEFQKEINNKSDKNIIYLDECGVKKNESCQHGWSHKSSRLHGLKGSSQHKAVNIIGSLNNHSEIIAPFVFKGSCTAEVFNAYLEKVLSQHLGGNAVVVLDNASFHKSSDIVQIAQEYGAEVLYLPPYSPDLNPIEHKWHQVKTKIQKILRDGCDSIYDAVCAATKMLSK
ncbi:MAG: IS630 family transposase [Oligoflexales bacterium]